jgi:hypothetical protein
MRHIYTWGQAADVSKKMIQRNLSKGHSLAMCPGGAHEVSYSASYLWCCCWWQEV